MGARAANETMRWLAGSTTIPDDPGPDTQPFSPRTETVTLAVTSVGLARKRRVVRPVWVDPPTSHASDDASPHGAVANPEIDSLATCCDCTPAIWGSTSVVGAGANNCCGWVSESPDEASGAESAVCSMSVSRSEVTYSGTPKAPNDVASPLSVTTSAMLPGQMRRWSVGVGVTSCDLAVAVKLGRGTMHRKPTTAAAMAAPTRPAADRSPYLRKFLRFVIVTCQEIIGLVIFVINHGVSTPATLHARRPGGNCHEKREDDDE